MTLFTNIHAGEELTLHQDMECNVLQIHLGHPVTRIELAGHRLTWRHLEVVDSRPTTISGLVIPGSTGGRVEIWDGPILKRYWHRPATLGAGGA